MRRLSNLFCFLGVLALTAELAFAGTYTLTTGKEITGEPITIKDEAIKLKIGPDKYSDWITWDKLTQESLKTLLTEAKTPSEQNIIQQLIDQPAPVKAGTKEIIVKPIEKPPRPTEHIGLAAIFTSPLGLLIFLALYAATIFAGYEVAIYRDQPLGLVCGLAAVPFFGVISPIAFFFISRPSPPPPEPGETPGTAAPEAGSVLATSELADDSQAVKKAAPATASLSQNKSAGAQTSKLPAPVVFQRGDFSFNRRFFETKLVSFQRLVPTGADKDMVVWIKSVRGEYTGRRITQITPEDLHLQVFKADATADEVIPFVEILEVQIRHKDLA
jgi:hypothetical protein